jgi:hypothetical protein
MQKRKTPVGLASDLINSLMEDHQAMSPSLKELYKLGVDKLLELERHEFIKMLMENTKDTEEITSYIENNFDNNIKI